jgi:integrase
MAECKAGREWFKDMQSFGVYISKRPPKTIQTYIYGVKSFVEYSLGIEISKKKMKELKNRLPKGKRARTEDGDLTRERFRNILTHCEDKGKALFLFLATSGIRIGEALQIQPYDIDWSSDPVKVRVRGETAKEGDAYYTFVSSEAKDALSEWLKVKDSYLRSAMNKGRGLSKTVKGRGIKDANDSRIFPFSMSVANSMWMVAVKKAKLADRDASTNRFKFHIHILRKFFQSQMKYANVPDDVVEALVGHVGYLDDAYRRYSQQQVAEMYKKGEPYLLVNVPTGIQEIQTKFNSDNEKMKQEIQDLYRKISDSQQLSTQLDLERRKLEQRVKMHEEIFKQMTEMPFEEFAKWMQEKNRWEWQQQKEEDKKQAEERPR